MIALLFLLALLFPFSAASSLVYKNRDGYVGVEMEDVAGTCSSRIGWMAF
jgi:hypothetical protein